MFQEEFQKRYTTIPLAIYRAHFRRNEGGAVSHQHKEFELLAVTDGEANLYVDSRFYKIKKGDVVFIPPYAIHRITTDKNYVTSYYCICFDGKLLCDNALVTALETGELEGAHRIPYQDETTPFLFSCIERAFLACEQANQGWEMESVGNLSLFFATLKKDGYFRPTTKNKTKNDFAQKTLAFIAANFQQTVTSHDAATALYVSVSHFCRIFKKTFGCCFAQYLTGYRLERAKWALLNTDKSITEIAYSCGFHDCSYFAKTFRLEYGLSPRTYRNKTQNA